MVEDSNQLILTELKKISQILMLTNSEKIEEEIGRIATSPERKKIWVLIDGQRTALEIVKQAGVDQSVVSRFLKTVKDAGFIEYLKTKPPKKILEYTPPKWIDLLETTSEDHKKKGE